jgi:SAM-dependent methyltransferase
MRRLDRLLQRWRMGIANRWIPRGSRVLDIGCHQGELFHCLGERIGPSVGIDPQVQASASPRHQLMPLEFAGRLPFADASFDVVVLLATLEHLDHKAALAAECARVLSRGGRVVITLPGPAVDGILAILTRLHVVEGMSLEQHHGFAPEEVPLYFAQPHFDLEKHSRFQLGLNHLFVFRRR